MTSDVAESPQHLLARYFEMWNTGDSSIAVEILSPDWIDHAHPEMTGPQSVQHAVERIRAAQPDLRFQIDAVLGDGDLIAVVGRAGRHPLDQSQASRLVWLIRLEDSRMREMWTYRDTSK
ncbi:nuclear transport factor 2 family protein [Planotetraspora sp. A-T 1434]|uniref:ester cyclase n=1 Tax=Planotetraspora sp. A-T 1434 TaxID=2979219 RepID=UPI0021C0DD81|nr:nuclear transport factor 2 family protein [Planotetraspora sp. A-T 1434]MCT9928641.1 nuclear transport factor 2 family protein [Planotetraspora sp. A-T 1434]